MNCFAPVAFSRMTSCLDSLQLQAAGRHPGWLASLPGMAGADGKSRKQAIRIHKQPTQHNTRPKDRQQMIHNANTTMGNGKHHDAKLIHSLSN
jgi:hypothetical protein